LLKAPENAVAKPGANGILLYQKKKEKAGGKGGIIMICIYINAFLIAGKAKTIQILNNNCSNSICDVE